jgi:hypothetical protein
MQARFPGDADTTPDGFFGAWLLCNAALNHHWFCDPRLGAAVGKAETVEAADPRSAGALWEQIDRELVDRAAWVPLVNPHWIDFVSSRAHDYEAFPNLGLIADQVSLRWAKPSLNPGADPAHRTAAAEDRAALSLSGSQAAA